MGSCFSRGRSSSDTSSPRNSLFGHSVKSQQLINWKATGVVGLRDQKLKELPDNLLQVSSTVRVLDFSNNKLSELPKALSNFVSLQRLLLASNNIQTVPAYISSLSLLRILNLDLNNLGSLPEELGALTKLESLSVYGNHLTDLPSSIGQLKALKILNLGRNNLPTVRQEVGSCVTLEELDLAYNAITSIPAELGNLKKLKSINLDNNKVCGLPSELLTGCSALHTLSLHGNPITPSDLQAVVGFDQYELRRKQKYDKVISSNAMLGRNGLDEGVDRDPPRQAT